MFQRLHPFVVRGMILLLMLAPLQAASVSAADPWPDLPAMVLRPADLLAAGLPVAGEPDSVSFGYGAHHSLLTDRPHRAAALVDEMFSDIQVADHTAVRIANADLTYVHLLENPSRDRIAIILLAYDTEAGARDGLDAYLSTLEAGTSLTQLDATLDDADDFSAYEGKGLYQHGSTFNRRAVVLRHGTTVAALHALPANSQVNTEVMLDLAAAQRDRLEAGTSTGISHLVHGLMRFRSEGTQSKMDLYWAAEGEGIAMSANLTNPESDYQRRTNLADSGLVSSYHLMQSVFGPRPDYGNPRGLSYVHIIIDQYDPAIGAPDPDSTLWEMEDRYVLADSPVDGYESLAVVWDSDHPNSYVAHVWLDDNTTIRFVYMFFPDDLDEIDFDLDRAIGQLNQHIARQLACFAGERTCPATTSVPAGFLPVG